MRQEIVKRYGLHDFGKMGKRIDIRFSRDIYTTRDLLDLFKEIKEKIESEIEFLIKEIG